ncbi:uncharacterized protein LOC120332917 [Styela clava]
MFYAVRTISITTLFLALEITASSNKNKAGGVYTINSTHCEYCYNTTCKIRHDAICGNYNLSDNKAIGIGISVGVVGFILIVWLCNKLLSRKRTNTLPNTQDL